MVSYPAALTLSDFRAFRPEGLDKQQPELGALLELRRRLATASPPGVVPQPQEGSMF